MRSKVVVSPVGEVVPAREGLRLTFLLRTLNTIRVGEVVPAKEGLRQGHPYATNKNHNGRRGCSSKRRIKTILFSFNREIKSQSERLFQQEKD